MEKQIRDEKKGKELKLWRLNFLMKLHAHRVCTKEIGLSHVQPWKVRLIFAYFDIIFNDDCSYDDDERVNCIL